MNVFEQLLATSEAEKKRLGIQYTPSEIAQQPEMWLKTSQLLLEQRNRINAFLKATGVKGEKRATLLLCGAGSSGYIGTAVLYGLRKHFKRQVFSVPTTDMITHPQAFLHNGTPSVVVSFARSGNSPESLATYNFVKQFAPQTPQIVVTCNHQGELAKTAAEDAHTLCLILPEATNDRSLVMTSSFSTMAFTALGTGVLDDADALIALAEKLGNGAQRIMAVYADTLQEFITQSAIRVQYLGSGALFGTMEECRLKLLEMNDGKIAANVNSFVGLRHGPQVFVNDDCLVVAALASDPYVRQYELDLLRELQRKGQGMGTVIICDKANADIESLASFCLELYPEGDAVEDEYRIMTDVVVGQMLGTFKSMDLGLKPDSPSANGTISRVVQGVTIYPLQA